MKEQKSKKNKRLKHQPYYQFKTILDENDKTQKDVAKWIKKDPVTVNQKINGTLDFTFTEINIICDKLEISSEIFRSKKVS